MPWEYTDRAVLERAAPWADLEEIRADFLQQIKGHPHYYRIKNHIASYEQGMTPILPRPLLFYTHLYKIIDDFIARHNIQEPTNNIGIIRDRFYTYFFNPDFWIETDSE